MTATNKNIVTMEDEKNRQVAAQSRRRGFYLGRGWLMALCGVMIVLMLVFSRPSLEQQLDAVKAATRDYINRSIDSTMISQVPVLGAVVSEGGKWAGDKVMQDYLTGNYRFHDYYLWTEGKLKLDDGEHRVAVGLLGHTFVTDEECLSQVMGVAVRSKVAGSAATVVAALLQSLFQ